MTFQVLLVHRSLTQAWISVETAKLAKIVSGGKSKTSVILETRHFDDVNSAVIISSVSKAVPN